MAGRTVAMTPLTVTTGYSPDGHVACYFFFSNLCAHFYLLLLSGTEAATEDTVVAMEDTEEAAATEAATEAAAATEAVEWVWIWPECEEPTEWEVDTADTEADTAVADTEADMEATVDTMEAATAVATTVTIKFRLAVGRCAVFEEGVS
jgi:hypothetical protein